MPIVKDSAKNLPEKVIFNTERPDDISEERQQLIDDILDQSRKLVKKPRYQDMIITKVIRVENINFGWGDPVNLNISTDRRGRLNFDISILENPLKKIYGIDLERSDEYSLKVLHGIISGYTAPII